MLNILWKAFIFPFRICWKASKWLFRKCWRIFKWPFLLTLPWTILPITCGIVNGIYFANWSSGQLDKNIDAFLYDMKDVNSDWGTVGFTFRDFQDINNDFHVVRINTNDWVAKLGFVLPEQYQAELDTPINNYASLDTLMLDVRPSCGPRPPKEQWVYISNYAMAWRDSSNWDGTFDTAVEAAYVPSRLNNTRLFFATCHGTASFLCGVWGVKSPTLLHFLVEDSPLLPEEVRGGLTYSTDLSDLRPVTVRVVEFPLEGAYTGLSSDVFGGPKEQMLAIMRGDKLYEQFEPWSDAEQRLRRFNDLLKITYDKKGTFLYYLGETDEWITDHLAEPLGLKDGLEYIHLGFFLSTVGLANILVLPPYYLAKHVVLLFIGYPKRGDQIMGDGSTKDWDPWNDLLGGMMEGFGDVVAEGMKQAKMEINWPGGKVTTTSAYGETLNSITGSTASLFPGATTYSISGAAAAEPSRDPAIEKILRELFPRPSSKSKAAEPTRSSDPDIEKFMRELFPEYDNF
jgi:hypothetical protein